MKKYLVVLIIIVLVTSLGSGVWWWRSCFVDLTIDSKLIKIVKIDRWKLNKFVQSFIACRGGYFELIENPNSQKKIRVKKINIRLADTFIGVKIGADRNKPDYSFWWEKGKSGNLNLTTWINPDKRSGSKFWKENLVVALTYLKNDMEAKSLGEAKQLFDSVVSADFGLVLQRL